MGAADFPLGGSFLLGMTFNLLLIVEKIVNLLVVLFLESKGCVSF